MQLIVKDKSMNKFNVFSAVIFSVFLLMSPHAFSNENYPNEDQIKTDLFATILGGTAWRFGDFNKLKSFDILDKKELLEGNILQIEAEFEKVYKSKNNNIMYGKNAYKKDNVNMIKIIYKKFDDKWLFVTSYVTSTVS